QVSSRSSGTAAPYPRTGSANDHAQSCLTDLLSWTVHDERSGLNCAVKVQVDLLLNRERSRARFCDGENGFALNAHHMSDQQDQGRSMPSLSQHPLGDRVSVAWISSLCRNREPRRSIQP